MENLMLILLLYIHIVSQCIYICAHPFRLKDGDRKSQKGVISINHTTIVSWRIKSTEEYKYDGYSVPSPFGILTLPKNSGIVLIGLILERGRVEKLVKRNWMKGINAFKDLWFYRSFT